MWVCGRRCLSRAWRDRIFEKGVGGCGANLLRLGDSDRGPGQQFRHHAALAPLSRSRQVPKNHALPAFPSFGPRSLLTRCLQGMDAEARPPGGRPGDPRLRGRLV